MLSKKLVNDFRKIASTNLKLELTNKEAKELGEFLVLYFGLLTGINNE
jgi:hypothetical protein